jgi:hypothetical protein
MNSVAFQLFEILECCQSTFAREAIERPEEKQIKFPYRGIRKHSPKFRPVRSAAGIVVFVNLHDDPTLGGAPVLELAQLIGGILAFVSC